ncbi:MAG: Minf_1886 family protein [Candidatus Krumholzibacteriia bacterium]
MENHLELHKEVRERVETIRSRDRRYHADAYLFVIDVVEAVLLEIVRMRHISGSELCRGLRTLATARFGPMAKEVLNFWGVRSTEDFGNIVFNLVDAGLLLKTEHDRIEDFIDVYDFGEVFERNYFEA